MSRKRKEPHALIYKNWLAMFMALDRDQNGEILEAISHHVVLGEDIEVSEAIQPMIEMILKEIDANMENYEHRCDTNQATAINREAKKKQERATNVTQTCNERDTKGAPTNTKTNTKTNTISLSNDKEKELDTSDKPKQSSARFVPPSIEEVKTYCDERQNRVDPESFVSFYESNGWKVGKNPMKNWKAAVRTWEQRSNEIHSNAMNSLATTKQSEAEFWDQMMKEAEEHDRSNSCDIISNVFTGLPVAVQQNNQ